MNPELMMLVDTTDSAAVFIVWCGWIFLILLGLATFGLSVIFGIQLAIRYSIRYLWRRMAQGRI